MVELVFADNPSPFTGAGNNTWLIDGDEPTLIDAGAGVPSHLARLQQLLGSRSLVRVIVTHGHPDHASGVPALRALWPNIEVCRFTGSDDEAAVPLVDGDEVRAGDRVLRAEYTPGHASDHICLWDPLSRELFCGDMLMRPGTVLIPAGRGGSLRQYLDSLRRIAELDPRRVYPGHGPIIENALEVVAEYLEQRRRREVQVLSAVEAGAVDAAAIVARLYPNLEGGLERAATMTVQAHLDKLREEGRLP